MTKDRPRFSAACPSSLYVTWIQFPGPEPSEGSVHDAGVADTAAASGIPGV